MITALGVALLANDRFQRSYQVSLETLGKLQTDLGYIHRAIHLDTMAKDCNAHGSVDSNMWFILGHYNYYRHAQDLDFLRTNWDKIEKAFLWLRYQDFNDCGLIEVHEAGDWEDLLSIRGNVLYDNVLYAYTWDVMAELARILGQNTKQYHEQGEIVRQKINLLLWVTRGGKDWRNPSVAERLEKITAAHQEWHWVAEPMMGVLWERPFYLQYVTYRDYGDYFDLLGNSLAILTGLADEDKTGQILDYVYRAGIDLPYPGKAIYPVIQPGHRHWREYYRNRNLNLPHQYHNGGIWPMVGGFYVAALVKAGRKLDAEHQLEKLAEANRQGLRHEWEFNEFLHGITGRPLGAVGNAWSAGMFIYAYQCVDQGDLLPPFDKIPR
jgi:glycogen debranching enzyme